MGSWAALDSSHLPNAGEHSYQTAPNIGPRFNGEFDPGSGRTQAPMMAWPNIKWTTCYPKARTVVCNCEPTMSADPKVSPKNEVSELVNRKREYLVMKEFSRFSASQLREGAVAGESPRGSMIVANHSNRAAGPHHLSRPRRLWASIRAAPQNFCVSVGSMM
jgi:hypothetical protein